MKLILFAFGKLKTPGLRESADYYLKLLRPQPGIEEIELRALPVPDKSSATRKRIQEQEGALLEELFSKRLSPRARIHLLDERGKAAPTTQWAEDMDQALLDSVPELAFCIGSSLGFSEALRKRAHRLVSLGPQTLPHELARVVLLEQLFRAWSFRSGHPYHNEG